MIENDSLCSDPIVADVRRIREEYLERFHGDLDAIVAEMRREFPDIAEIARPPKKSTGRPQIQRRTPNSERQTQQRTTP